MGKALQARHARRKTHRRARDRWAERQCDKSSFITRGGGQGQDGQQSRQSSTPRTLQQGDAKQHAVCMTASRVGVASRAAIRIQSAWHTLHNTTRGSHSTCQISSNQYQAGRQGAGTGTGQAGMRSRGVEAIQPF